MATRFRKSGVMQLKAGKEEEYRASHNEGFWPEMAACLREHGAHNYYISLMPGTNFLFAFVEVDDEAKWATIKNSETCKRWWAWMQCVAPRRARWRPARAPLSSPDAPRAPNRAPPQGVHRVQRRRCARLH
jgi:L-rhamnose mutarotase